MYNEHPPNLTQPLPLNSELYKFTVSGGGGKLSCKPREDATSGLERAVLSARHCRREEQPHFINLNRSTANVTDSGQDRAQRWSHCRSQRDQKENLFRHSSDIHVLLHFCVFSHCSIFNKFTSKLTRAS